MRNFPFWLKHDSIRPPVCLDRHKKKWSKASKWMLLLLKNYVALHLVPPFAGTSPSLPYTCLFIFSFFSSPKIPRVCCGPESCSWSSANLERSSAFLEIWGEREARDWLYTKMQKSTSCLITTNTRSRSWIFRVESEVEHQMQKHCCAPATEWGISFSPKMTQLLFKPK